MGLKELPDRESVREVLAGGHEPFEVDEGAHSVAWTRAGASASMTHLSQLVCLW